MDPLIVLFGLGVGMLVGMTGVGGGSLMTPLLILVAGVQPVIAVGTDLAYGAVTKTVGGWRHFRQHTVDLKLSTWMAFGSIPAAIGGVYVLELLKRAYGDNFDTLLLGFVAGAVLFVGVAVLVRALFLQHLIKRERESFEFERRHKIAAVVVGVFVGFVLGVTSAGSGSLIAIALIMLFRLVPTRVVGTDVFHAALLLWAAALAHVVAGNVDYGLAGNILVGSLPGVWLGSQWAVKVPVATLRIALGLVLMGAGLGLASKAGANVPAPLLAAVPITLFAIVAAQRWRRLRTVREPPQEHAAGAALAPSPERV